MSNHPSDQIHVIIGPTASGKSAYCVDLALQLNGEVISADAYQIYHDFNIGTGTLLPHEMKEVPHHLINDRHPEHPYNVQLFLSDVHRCIDTISSHHRPVIICGGTAMYLKALLYGYQPLQRLPTSEKPTGTHDQLWNQLNDIDPDLASKTPKQNKQRVQRYLELHMIYGVQPSSLFKQQPLDTDRYKVTGILIDNNNLKQKINRRVDQMISDGLIDEVEGLMKKYSLDSPPFKAIGYKEVVEYLQGGVSKESMIETIKTNTKRYAKKQMTWLRTFTHVEWITI